MRYCQIVHIKQILHKNYTKKYFEEILTENNIWHLYNNTDYIAIFFDNVVI